MKIKNVSVIIILFFLMFAIGMFLWNKEESKEKNDIANNKLTAYQTLDAFFDFLVNKNYEDAVKIFYPVNENGDYDWNMLVYHTPNKENPTKAEDLAYYCEAVGTCLDVEILKSIEKEKDFYFFEVQFKDENGNIFLYGPFGGVTADNTPPKTKFQYYVKKIDGIYKVITPPLYRP